MEHLSPDQSPSLLVLDLWRTNYPVLSQSRIQSFPVVLLLLLKWKGFMDGKIDHG